MKAIHLEDLVFVCVLFMVENDFAEYKHCKVIKN